MVLFFFVSRSQSNEKKKFYFSQKSYERDWACSCELYICLIVYTAKLLRCTNFFFYFIFICVLKISHTKAPSEREIKKKNTSVYMNGMETEVIIRRARLWHTIQYTKTAQKRVTTKNQVHWKKKKHPRHSIENSIEYTYKWNYVSSWIYIHKISSVLYENKYQKISQYFPYITDWL